MENNKVGKWRITIKYVSLTLVLVVILLSPFLLAKILPTKEVAVNNIGEKLDSVNRWQVIESESVLIQSIRFEDRMKDTPDYLIETDEGIFRTTYDNVHNMYFTDNESYFTVRVSEEKIDERTSDNSAAERRATLSLYLKEEDFIPLSEHYAENYGGNLLFEKVNPRNNAFYNPSYKTLKGTWEEELFSKQ